MKFLIMLLFNVILGLIFLINLIYLLYRYYRDITLEQVSWMGQESRTNKDVSETSEDPVIWDQINLIRKKFYINFILVELSLISIFIFWGIVIFYKIVFI